MKNLTKILCLVLAMVMLFGLAACNPGSNQPKDTTDTSDKETDPTTPNTDPVDTDSILDELLPITGEDVEDIDAYVIESRKIYREQLAEYYTVYMAAKASDTISEKFAKMAVAEAKLLEAGVMLPSSTQGGMYAISRVVPGSISSVLWGNDSDRYHQAIVATEPLTSEDRDALKTTWKKMTSASEFEAYAKKYLTDHGYTIKDTYTIGYTSDPQTWDALATSQSADSEAIVNTYDGLLEYDIENNQVPALAVSYTVSDDGLVYTFKIREGVWWVDSQGTKIAEVQADDFVAGMQHALDAPDGLGYLVENVIAGVSEYVNGEITDFAEVGVKAVDKYTLTYTLTEPCTYFTTMMGYGIFAPMSRAYYQSQGGKFGAEFDAAADDYKYGTSPNNIAYCGPYVVTNATDKNTIVFQANESYWNKDNINIKTLTWLFNDGTDSLKAYNDMKSGVIDGCSLNSQALEVAKQDGTFDTYHYISSTNATTYSIFLNMNRSAYSNFTATEKYGSAASTLTEEQKTLANAAMSNQHFRLALCMSVDRASYNAASVGETLKLTSLRNSYTPGTFVSLEEEVTIDINGTSKTYPAGTYYGKILQDQLDADGYKIKVWDPEADSGIGSSDGFDGWYNVENAVEQLNLALAELKAEGYEISPENPVTLDYPYWKDSTVYTQKSQVVKQSIEEALGGNVVINLIPCVQMEWYYACYYYRSGDEANYHLNDLSGWGPDFGDPASYLDTFLPEGAGYMVKSIGIY